MKALANLAAGRLGDRVGRLAVLRTGWLFGLPVPWILYSAPSWKWVVFANVVLGVNQGLAWSSTVIMKIDLAGPKQRGLAMGLNEAAGYIAVSAAALFAGILSSTFGYREALLYVGGTTSVLGFALTTFVNETHAHVRIEAGRVQPIAKPFREVFLLTSWRDRNPFSVSQVGLVNNLNDGMAWGLFPLYFAAAGLSLDKVSILGAVYPAVWGLAQLFTGALSDRIGRRPMIVCGMLLQGLAILAIPLTDAFMHWILAAIALGLGTALVYPTLLAAISDVAHPDWRSSAIGVYRLWRDGGYVCGAPPGGFGRRRPQHPLGNCCHRNPDVVFRLIGRSHTCGDPSVSIQGRAINPRLIPALRMRKSRSLVPLIATGLQLRPKRSSINPRRSRSARNHWDHSGKEGRPKRIAKRCNTKSTPSS